MINWGGSRGKPYLPHPVMPAHALQASCGQDDGTELLQLIQLPKPRVEIPSLWRDAKDHKRCAVWSPMLFSAGVLLWLSDHHSVFSLMITANT